MSTANSGQTHQTCVGGSGPMCGTKRNDNRDLEPKIKIESVESLQSYSGKEAYSSGNHSNGNGHTEDEDGMPEIGSKNSAFLPYKQKQQSLTILTNLQRGNVQTYVRDALPQPLTFHERAAKGEIEISDINDGNVNELDVHGLPALHWASFHGRLSAAQMLVERGALMNAQGTGGETALMFAATNGHLEVLTYLLSKGAQVDLADEHGNTALMYATVGNYPRCVSELLNHGACLTRRNKFDDSPFAVAIAKNLHASQNAMEHYLKDYIESHLVRNSDS